MHDDLLDFRLLFEGSPDILLVLLPDSPRISFICEQGIEIGRPSFIHVTMYRQGHQITSLRIGGQCVSVGTGQIQV